MRVLVVLLALGAVAHADEGSAALGVGAFGGRPATVVDAGVDLSRDRLSIGLGARLRFVAGGGLRETEWDEGSEWLSIVRYATWRGREVGVVVGGLAGASLGEGAVVDGLTTGLNVDHRRVGAQAIARRGRFDGSMLIDDLVAPHMAAARGAYAPEDGVTLDATASVDLRETAVIGVGGAWTTWRLTVFGTIAGEAGQGAGAHAGVRGGVDGAELTLETALGTDGYVPWWFDPTWELTTDRPSSGRGARAVLRLSRDDIGEARFEGIVRAGGADVASGRLLLPAWRAAQLGAFVAWDSSLGPIVAAEARVRLPRGIFATAELSRLWSDGAAMTTPTPLWLATISVGASLGD